MIQIFKILFCMQLDVIPAHFTFKKLTKHLFSTHFSFYIVLRGRVSIYINNAISDEDDTSAITERLEAAEQKALNENTQLDRSAFGNYIAPLG